MKINKKNIEFFAEKYVNERVNIKKDHAVASLSGRRLFKCGKRSLKS